MTAEPFNLWQISLRQPEREHERLAQFLSPDERERAARFHFARDRRAYEAARGSLRWRLGERLGVAPTAVPIQYAHRGKPYLAEPHGRLKFNLSHAGDWALLAVSDGREIGVDIEQIRPLPELEQLAERFFSPAERAALRSLPPAQKPRAFFTCWTRKEAFIKALGDGLYQPLDGFDVTLLPHEPPRLLRVADDPTAVTRYSLHEIVAPEGYVAAAAIETTSG